MFTNEIQGVHALGALITAITSADRVDEVYEAALDALDRGLGVKRASILLFDSDGVMRFKAWRGLSDQYRQAVEGHTPWQPDATDASILMVPDVRNDTGLQRFQHTILAEGISSLAFVPLKRPAGVLGKFMLYFDEPRILIEHEQTLAEVIASQVAFAVQRLEAEQEATDREAELRLVTDFAPAYIAHCDRRCRYLFVNRPFADRFQLTPEQVIGRTVAEVLGTEVYERLRPLIEAALRGERVEQELELPYQDVGKRIMLARLAPNLDSQSQVLGFVAVITDVTERRRTDEAKDASFRRLADSLPQMVWMARADGHTDYFNERWYQFTGYPRGQTGDKSWTGIVHPDDLQRTLETWYEAVRRATPYEIEYRFFDRQTNAYRWQLGRALPLLNPDGSVARWFGTCTDIDDQKRAEQASRFLAEASRMLSTLVDYPAALETVARLAVPDFADWCAVDVVEDDGTMGRLSHAGSAELDFQPPALQSGHPAMITDISDGMLVNCARDEAHLQQLRHAGLKSSITVPLKAGTEVVGVLTFLTAGSGRRYHEADLTLAQELAYRAGIAIENARLYNAARAADRHKDEFLAVLAHELRNPLAPIRTALQLIRMPPDDPERRERACEVMDRQVLHMVRLVDDLLDVSRITSGKIELRKGREDLAAVVHRAVETSRPMIEAAGHQLSVSLPAEPIFVEADATRLAQVFSNLLNNAAKYTPRGGTVSISAEGEDGAAVVRVRDSGEGIPADMLTRIFDMFSQVDRSVEKAHGGLGIGLTLAKRLVELHDGIIEAASEGPGTGSEFVVRLPISTVGMPEAAAAPHSASVSGVAARRILVVDDNHDAADGLAEVLRLHGHQVGTANNGPEALRLAMRFRPHAVLLDLGMPNMSGYETAQLLRARLGTSVLIVATTGWGQDEHRQRSHRSGFDHHLVKPVDPDAVRELLKRIDLDS
jgi:PAS domain S-box-containing protein